MAGLASGGFIGLWLQLWLIGTRTCCAAGPTVGEALLAGLLIGFVAAGLVAFLAALHARLRFWGLFPPMLIVALLTGMIVALVARTITPLGVIALLAPLLGYLIGLLFCLLCRRLGVDPKGAGR